MFFLLAMSFSSCSKQSNTRISDLEKEFSTEVPLTDMNHSLQIVVDRNDTSFKSGSEIHLIVYNKSPYSVYFDNDSHWRLLGSQDNLHWTHVKNALTYSGTMLLSPKGTILLDTQYTLVQPILDSADFNSKTQNILLRIAIVGEIMEGNTKTGKNVGAYVDVSLKP